VKATDIYSLFEAQQELFEVAMNPSSLKKLAAAIPGVQVGMEFEMVVPDAQSEDEDEFEYEPDYGRDERATDIDDIVRFFGEADEQGICDFIAGRIDAHAKWQWQLRSILKVTRA
jgi:hypothetical protein